MNQTFQQGIRDKKKRHSQGYYSTVEFHELFQCNINTKVGLIIPHRYCKSSVLLEKLHFFLKQLTYCHVTLLTNVVKLVMSTCLVSYTPTLYILYSIVNSIIIFHLRGNAFVVMSSQAFQDMLWQM